MGQPQSKPSKPSIPRFPQPGDHIYCERKGGLYDHHGIYVGDDMVIHLQGAAKKLGELPTCHKCGDKRVVNGEIAKVCIDCFLDGDTLQIYEYGVTYPEFSKRKRGSADSYQIEGHIEGVIDTGPFAMVGASVVVAAYSISKGVSQKLSSW
ncbi:hypothetical protein V6Z11_A08G249900 [Gossypium hirsutum]